MRAACLQQVKTLLLLHNGTNISLAGNIQLSKAPQRVFQLPSTAVSFSQLRRHITQNVLEQRKMQTMLAAQTKVGKLGNVPGKEKFLLGPPWHFHIPSKYPPVNVFAHLWPFTSQHQDFTIQTSYMLQW